MASQPYALVNPICLLVDKQREDLTRQDLIRVIEKKQIERITFHYTALDGKLKELKLPIVNRYQVERILTDGERVDGSSLFKGLVDMALSDLYVVPVYKTAFLNPFDERSLDFICWYIMDDGSFAPFAFNTVLHRAYELFRKNTDLELYGLGEVEFYLLSPPSTPNYQAPRQKGYHGSSPFIKTGSILNEMVRHVAQIAGPVKYAHSEVGVIENVHSNLEEIKGKKGEQMEIEFLPVPMEDASDGLVLTRWLIRNIAHAHGCVATFTPKIEEGTAGNGFHVHVALIKNSRNNMTDGKGDLSEEARKLIGGLCTYADSLTAFGNTVFKD